ncbi:MAG: cytochrome c [Thermodesulfobacteriota bacterium]|nr:cytochrome c [Thermodesulfobacteriota bacterium]
MKKILSVLICVLFVASISSNVMAAGNWRKGRRLNRSECRTCHKRGGEAKRLRLNKRTKAEWTKFVNSPKTEYHEELWNELSDVEKKHLLKYFHKYAKDDKSTHLGCG